MAHGLVQQDSGPSRPEHDFHLSAGASRASSCKRLPRRFFGEESGLGRKEVQRNRPPPPEVPRPDDSRPEPASVSHAGNIQPRQRLQSLRQTCRRSQLQESSAIRRRSQPLLDRASYPRAVRSARISSFTLAVMSASPKAARTDRSCCARRLLESRRPSPWPARSQSAPRCARMKNRCGEDRRWHTGALAKTTRTPQPAEIPCEPTSPAIHPPSARSSQFKIEVGVVAARESARPDKSPDRGS